MSEFITIDDDDDNDGDGSCGETKVARQGIHIPYMWVWFGDKAKKV